MFIPLNKSKGFTLVEVMIALVVMAIGMLGLASIQAVGLQNNTTAYYRTLAMQEAYNIADIIRTGNASDGTVLTDFNTVTSAYNAGSPPSDCIVNNNTTDCTNAQMAAFDIYQWKARLASVLPKGRGKITNLGAGTADVTDDIYQIQIMWDEARSNATGEACGNDYNVDLKCYRLHIQL